MVMLMVLSTAPLQIAASFHRAAFYDDSSTRLNPNMFPIAVQIECPLRSLTAR